MSEIRVLRTIGELRSAIATERTKSHRIGLVPTMGALHQGHLSLVRQSIEQNDVTVATIFVNPTQFAANEDLGQYPRPFDNDVQLLAEAGADIVFAPSEQEIYRPGSSTSIVPPQVSQVLEGEFRPQHFGGVCTVVLKLFNIVLADAAFFGQKDFQQVAVIKQMVTDLDIPISIQVCPIVRDDDGLALSSRNVYLSTEERAVALGINRTLQATRKAVLEGESDGHLLMAEMRQMLIDAGVSSIDYAVVANPMTLAVLDEVSLPAVLLVAAHVGQTRLIDNILMERN